MMGCQECTLQGYPTPEPQADGTADAFSEDMFQLSLLALGAGISALGATELAGEFISEPALASLR